MRSCLFQLLFTLAILFCLVWFVVPIGVAALVQGALTSGGFSGTNTRVEVSSNPPFMLLTGNADRVHITSTDASMGDLHASSVDVTLQGVNLLSRDIGTVTGTFGGVRIAAPNGDPVAIDAVTLSGEASATRATATLNVTTAARLAQSQIKAQTGFSSTVVLKAPDAVVLTIGGKSQTGRLVAVNGALVLIPSNSGMPTVTLVAPGSGNPFHVTGVRIDGSAMTLSGTLDTQALLS
jgi:hypothetical protein